MFLLSFVLILPAIVISNDNNEDSLTNLSLKKSNKRSSITTIFDDVHCSPLITLCDKIRDDFLILECVQNLKVDLVKDLNKQCQNTIYNHTLKVLDNEYVSDILKTVCIDEWPRAPCESDNKPFSALKCALKLKEDDSVSSSCLSTIKRFEQLAFSDYQWTSSFLEHCKSDIDKMECGRINAIHFSQVDTLSCLQNKIIDVSNICQNEVFKLSEMQAENIKYDRTIYVACAEEYTKYCNEFLPGSGRVLKCLMQHQNDKFSDMCKNQLLRKEKLIVEDYKVSRGLMKACRTDIFKSNCKKQNQDKQMRLAKVLLCLENYSHNGNKLDSSCELEISYHRKMLMKDYRLSPEIVADCSSDIKLFCLRVETGGKTIHCLMDRLRYKNLESRIGDVCQRALENLVKETDAGEDWRIDPVLHEACMSVVETSCRDVVEGNARVMSCLMNLLNSKVMTPKCEDALLHINYFVARNFKLDPQLYMDCKSDASKFCHAGNDWQNNDVDGPTNERLVLPCLYRYAYSHDKDKQLTPQCLYQVKRVMRQRAMNVDLQPEIEEACLQDLSKFCNKQTERGEEIMCLQKNFDYLDNNCQIAIFNFTKIETEHVEMNPYLMQYCNKAIETHCSNEFRHDEGDVLDCLISHKNDPDVKANLKCRTTIEHFHILSLKDYHFSPKFKTVCKNDAIRFCGDSKTKSSLVICLSEKFRDDTLLGRKSDIKKECRQQLKAQLFQIRENINYDPVLQAACKQDIQKYCKDIESGGGRILECLQSTEKQLTEECHKQVFKVKKQEFSDNSIDYVLLTTCADAIDQFCPRAEKEVILECLKRHKDEVGFNKKCYIVVNHRIKDQLMDYRLNPSLQDNCRMDIAKFCSDIVSHAKSDKELNGDVIKCLKVAFKKSILTNKCEKEMVTILRDQALDIELDPLLRALCQAELSTICKNENDAEECLKKALLEHKIQDRSCKEEVANLIEIAQADIHVDPLLQNACALDILKHCSEIPQGGGRHIKCLKEYSSDLSSDCKEMLTERLQMYRNAEEIVPIDGVQNLYLQVKISPVRNYLFVVIFMIFGSFFIIGLFCGRVSNRNRFSKMK